jgi:D-2-hydroxyglutarate dehydrogenase
MAFLFAHICLCSVCILQAPAYNETLRESLEPWVYQWTASRRGSISAEHGLGAMKAEYIGYSKTEAVVESMRAIKHVLDPHGLLNPYKVLPNSSA